MRNSNARVFVDLSSNNPFPDLGAYSRAGHRHVARKVSEGVDYHWDGGDRLADLAHGHGLHVGHYHWLREDADAHAQAAYFVRLVRARLGAAPYPGSWPYDGDWLMVDVEQTAGVSFPGDRVRAAQLRDFCADVTAALPDWPLVAYLPTWYCDGRPHLQAEGCRHVIVASDYDNVDQLPNPYGFTFGVWQYSDKATVAGIGAPVDVNRFMPLGPVQAYLGNPTLKDRIMLKIARTVVTNAMRAVLYGGDHGYFTRARFGFVKDADQGVIDRLARLEKQVSDLSASVSPKP